MPSRLPVRFAWPKRVPPLAITTPRCLRAFTSTPSARGLGPESPNFVHVPKLVQPSFPPRPRIKGVLPTPRDVFKVRSRQAKQSPRFVRRLTLEKMEKNVKPISPYDPNKDYRAYKRQLTATRKENLRQGIQQLYERKTTMEAQRKAIAQRRQEERRAAVYAPRKTADVLTENTMQKDLRDFLEDRLPSSSRFRSSESQRLRFQARLAKQAAVRQARLHDLYINAREFIVDEQQLDEAIEKAFGTDERPVQWDEKGNPVVDTDDYSSENYGSSPWHGPLPDGVSELLKNLTTGEGAGLAKERMKKVAEVLTGGKM